MPFSIPSDFKAALGRTIRLSLALRAVRGDGQVAAWTNHVRDVQLPQLTVGLVTVPSTLYGSGGCVFPASLQQSDDPRKVDNWEFTAFFDERASAAEVSKGFFRGRPFTLLVFGREDLTWQMLRARGTFGEHTLYKDRVVWKMRGLSQLLAQEVLEVTSPLSRARWGDPELDFFDLDGDTADGHPARVTGAIASVDVTYPRRRFTLPAAADLPAGRLSDGTVEWLSGDNVGYTAQVLDHDAGTGALLLADDAPEAIAVGDSVRAQIKAPLTLEEWMAFFGDGRYFAGEPLLPTVETMAQVNQ